MVKGQPFLIRERVRNGGSKRLGFVVGPGCSLSAEARNLSSCLVRFELCFNNLRIMIFQMKECFEVLVALSLSRWTRFSLATHE